MKNFLSIIRIVAFLNLHWQTRSHVERGESLQNQDFVGGMQNRRRFAPTIFLVQKLFSKICGVYCTTFEPILASIRTRTDCARSACVVALYRILRPDFAPMRPKPARRRARRQPRKKNAPCISDFAGGGGTQVEKRKGV